jgi:hypothetical protein
MSYILAVFRHTIEQLIVVHASMHHTINVPESSEHDFASKWCLLELSDVWLDKLSICPSKDVWLGKP